jgi:hypothetical protein
MEMYFDWIENLVQNSHMERCMKRCILSQSESLCSSRLDIKKEAFLQLIIIDLNIPLYFKNQFTSRHSRIFNLAR